MPILIPSKNIYQVENPKVRDNVIERIEVSAVEVVPDNEYETPVYNGTFENIFSIGVNQNDTEMKVDAYGYIAYISYVEAIPQYGNIKNIDVAVLKNNHYVEKLLLGKDENENPNIKISLIGNIYKGYATQQRASSTSGGTNIKEVVYQEPTYKENGVRYELPELTISNTVDSGNGLYVATASVNVNNETNLVSLTSKKITIQNIEYFRIENLKILCGLKFAKIGKILSFTNPDNLGTYTLEGEYEEYVPTRIEITIYGNTIGIDLKDSVVHINNGDSTSKKVFAVDGNELMQTTNYKKLEESEYKLLKEFSYITGEGDYDATYEEDRDYPEWYTRVIINFRDTRFIGKTIAVRFFEEDEDGTIRNEWEYKEKIGASNSSDSGQQYYFDRIEVYEIVTEKPFIETAFLDTKNEYSNGKETATIRCSISDYYEFNKPTLARYCKISDNGLVDISNNIRATISFGAVTKLNVYFVDETPYDTFVSWSVKLKKTDGTIMEKSGIIYTGSISATGMRISSSVESIVSVSAYFQKNMVFSTHDKVVPMVYGANGQDKPLSVYKDGTPKVFNVLGVEFLYDGAVWQILNLQEE